MQPPLTPFNESLRIEALHQLNILDTKPEPVFDQITSLAADLFEVPTALVSLVDSNRQWFKSRYGFDSDETNRDVSFCAHAINHFQLNVPETRIFEVSDALNDDRFNQNSLVLNNPKIRFYAGYVLQSEDKYNLGTLCIIDKRPRTLLDLEKERLVQLGKLTQHALPQSPGVVKDNQTDLYNLNGFTAIAEYIISTCITSKKMYSVSYFHLHNAQSIDTVKSFADSLFFTYRKTDLLARISKSCFVVIQIQSELASSNTHIKYDDAITRLKVEVAQSNLKNKKTQINYQAGLFNCHPEFVHSSEMLLSLITSQNVRSNYDDDYSLF